MVDHSGVLVMQKLLMAGALGLSMAQKAAAILDGEPAGIPLPPSPEGLALQKSQLTEGAVLRAVLDAANECLGHFDDRPASERWCDALLHLLDLAAFATDLGSAGAASADPDPANGQAANLGPANGQATDRDEADGQAVDEACA
jgi:hypothetical protein